MDEQITRSIIVKGRAEDIFNLWANFENFPKFMKNIKSVTNTGEKASHWVMEGPAGMKIEWDAEVTRYEPGKRIAWSSKDREDADIKTSGQVTFNQLPENETEVTVLMQYVPLRGLIGDIGAKLFSNPEKQLEEDLEHFKHFAEGMYQRTAQK